MGEFFFENVCLQVVLNPLLNMRQAKKLMDRGPGVWILHEAPLDDILEGKRISLRQREVLVLADFVA